jgi:GNAT superfamily N-acetyltransferase
MSAAMAGEINCVELEPDLWPDLEALFGPRGACAGCWCMWWRVERGGALWEKTRGAPAKRAFKRLVNEGTAHGILAYAGDQPVGWCAFGPREDFPRISTVRAYKDVAIPPRLWSINCFFIQRDWRGRGVAGALLDAALRACKRAGAAVVEGYPVEGKSSAAFAWTGPRSIFDRRGFRAIDTGPTAKPLVRLKLRG